MKQVRLEDANLSKEAFEVLTITLALCPAVLEVLIREKFWHLFVIDTLLLSGNRWVNMSFASFFLRLAVNGKRICFPYNYPQDVSVGGSMKVWGGSLFKKVSGIFLGKLKFLTNLFPESQRFLQKIYLTQLSFSCFKLKIRSTRTLFYFTLY